VYASGRVKHDASESRACLHFAWGELHHSPSI
jgi:hypothetical protein